MSGHVPVGWTAIDLRSAIGDGVFADGDWVESKDQDPDGGVRLIQLADVGEGRFIDKSSRFLTATKATELGCTFLEPGDVLVSRMADPIGRACIFPGAGQPCVTVVDVCIVRPQKGRLDPTWLTHTINSPQFRAKVELAASGTTRSRVSRSNLGALELPLPPLNEQRRIVAKLEALQARSRRAREALDAVPPLLEKLRQSILTAAFRGDLTKDWRAKHPDVEPATELLKRIRVERRKKWEEAELAKLKGKGKAPTDDRWKAKYKEPEPVDASRLPELPEGWCWASLSEVASLQLGQRRAPEYSKERAYPYVRAANITWRGLDLTDLKTMGFADPDSVSLLPGDIILSEASGSRSEVGKPALWNGEIEACCFQATVLRTRPNSDLIRSDWLYFAFLRNALLGHFAAIAPGVGILHLTAERMRGWPVPLAPVNEQDRVTSVVRAAMERSYRAEDTLQGLERLERTLGAAVLAKAFRGELVPQDPNDEPAEALLARLRAETPADDSKPRRRGRAQAAQ